MYEVVVTEADGNEIIDQYLHEARAREQFEHYCSKLPSAQVILFDIEKEKELAFREQG